MSGRNHHSCRIQRYETRNKSQKTRYNRQDNNEKYIMIKTIQYKATSALKQRKSCDIIPSVREFEHNADIPRRKYQSVDGKHVVGLEHTPGKGPTVDCNSKVLQTAPVDWAICRHECENIALPR